MPKFHVHERHVVRVKFRDVEAASHKAAIDRVMNENQFRNAAISILQSEPKGPGLIEHTEIDDGEQLGFLVDLAGDEEYDQSFHFDPHPITGEIVISDDPFNPVHSDICKAALGQLEENYDPRYFERLAHRDPLAALIASETNVATNEADVALARLDDVMAQIAVSRQAILDHLAGQK